MCETCWAEYGRPRLRSEAILKAAGAIGALYELEPVGGAAHIVVDDWNLEDHHIAWCLENVSKYSHGTESEAAARACLEAMAPLSEVERASALAIYDGLAGEAPGGKSDYVRWSEQDLDPALVDPIDPGEWK